MTDIEQERAAIQYAKENDLNCSYSQTVEAFKAGAAWQARAQQPSAEPVGYFCNDAAIGSRPHWSQVSDDCRNDPDVVALYARPAADVLADAERYRWLRSRSRSQMYNEGVDLDWYGPTENLDAAIDVARAKGGADHD